MALFKKAVVSEFQESAQLLVNHLSEVANRTRSEVAGHLFDGVDEKSLKLPKNVTIVDEPGDLKLVVARPDAIA